MPLIQTFLRQTEVNLWVQDLYSKMARIQEQEKKEEKEEGGGEGGRRRRRRRRRRRKKKDRRGEEGGREGGRRKKKKEEEEEEEETRKEILFLSWAFSSSPLPKPGFLSLCAPNSSESVTLYMQATTGCWLASPGGKSSWSGSDRFKGWISDCRKTFSGLKEDAAEKDGCKVGLSSCHRLESIGNKREMESDNLGLNQAELLEGGWKCKTHTTEIRIPTCSGPFILQRNFLPNPPRIHRKRKEVSAHHVSVTHSILLMAPKLGCYP